MLCSQLYPKCCAWTPLRAFIEHISLVWIIFSLSGSLVCTEQNTFNILKSNYLSHCTIECPRIISSPFCFWQTFKTWRLDWHIWAGSCSCSNSSVILWDADLSPLFSSERNEVSAVPKKSIFLLRFETLRFEMNSKVDITSNSCKEGRKEKFRSKATFHA